MPFDWANRRSTRHDRSPWPSRQQIAWKRILQVWLLNDGINSFASSQEVNIW